MSHSEEKPFKYVKKLQPITIPCYEYHVRAGVLKKVAMQRLVLRTISRNMKKDTSYPNHTM